jgi:hypothetical protein
MKLLRFVLLLGALLSLTQVVSAANRTLRLIIPPKAIAGTNVELRVKVSTDAGAGEQIGFLHIEVSKDGGQNWTPVIYEQNLGERFESNWQVETGSKGTWTLLRVRAAFRGGVAGDVDYKGAAIKWHDTWAGWQEPPSVHGRIEVR